MITTLILRASASALHFQFSIRRGGQSVLLAHGSFQGIGSPGAFLRISADDEYSETLTVADHRHALRQLIDYLHRNSHITALLDIHAVIYRISNGGDAFKETTLFTRDDIPSLSSISHLAPEGRAVSRLVAAGLSQLPSAAHVGVFDTAFFQLLPEASSYALQPALAGSLGIRRYGFNGIMHKAAADKADKAGRRVISIIIDDDVSVAAVRNGVAIETTAGFTPAEGLPGLHRSGSLDPRIPLYLAAHLQATPQQIDTLLSQNSGIAALSGKQSYHEIIAAAHKRDRPSIAALMLLSYEISKATAAMTAALGGVDAMVFSGKGADWIIIEEVCRRLSHLGVQVQKRTQQRLSTARSRVVVSHVELDEASVLMTEAKSVIGAQSSRKFHKKFLNHRPERSVVTRKRKRR